MILQILPPPPLHHSIIPQTHHHLILINHSFNLKHSIILILNILIIHLVHQTRFTLTLTIIIHTIITSLSLRFNILKLNLIHPFNLIHPLVLSLVSKLFPLQALILLASIQDLLTIQLLPFIIRLITFIQITHNLNLHSIAHSLSPVHLTHPINLPLPSLLVIASLLIQSFVPTPLPLSIFTQHLSLAIFHLLSLELVHLVHSCPNSAQFFILMVLSNKVLLNSIVSDHLDSVQFARVPIKALINMALS